MTICLRHQGNRPASTSETSANFYQTTRPNNPEDNHLHTRRPENLKFHNLEVFRQICAGTSSRQFGQNQSNGSQSMDDTVKSVLIISKTARLTSTEKSVLDIKCVLHLSSQRFFETFFARDIQGNARRYSCKVTVIFVRF
jgi:hypothetical protein